MPEYKNNGLAKRLSNSTRIIYNWNPPGGTHEIWITKIRSHSLFKSKYIKMLVGKSIENVSLAIVLPLRDINLWRAINYLPNNIFWARARTRWLISANVAASPLDVRHWIIFALAFASHLYLILYKRWFRSSRNKLYREDFIESRLWKIRNTREINIKQQLYAGS